VAPPFHISQVVIQYRRGFWPPVPTATVQKSLKEPSIRGPRRHLQPAMLHGFINHLKRYWWRRADNPELWTWV